MADDGRRMTGGGRPGRPRRHEQRAGWCRRRSEGHTTPHDSESGRRAAPRPAWRKTQSCAGRQPRLHERAGSGGCVPGRAGSVPAGAAPLAGWYRRRRVDRRLWRRSTHHTANAPHPMPHRNAAEPTPFIGQCVPLQSIRRREPDLTGSGHAAAAAEVGGRPWAQLSRGGAADINISSRVLLAGSGSSLIIALPRSYSASGTGAAAPDSPREAVNHAQIRAGSSVWAATTIITLRYTCTRAAAKGAWLLSRVESGTSGRVMRHRCVGRWRWRRRRRRQRLWRRRRRRRRRRCRGQLIWSTDSSLAGLRLLRDRDRAEVRQTGRGHRQGAQPPGHRRAGPPASCTPGPARRSGGPMVRSCGSMVRPCGPSGGPGSDICGPVWCVGLKRIFHRAGPPYQLTYNFCSPDVSKCLSVSVI